MSTQPRGTGDMMYILFKPGTKGICIGKKKLGKNGLIDEIIYLQERYGDV